MSAAESDRPHEERGEPSGPGPGTSEAPDPEADLFRRVKEELAPGLELVRLLGRGVAASVYLAREPALRRLVAVKLLLPELGDDPKARLRFEREAQSAARIAHPNVVPLYRVGVLSDDLPYIVMQYVKGRSLADRLLAEGPFDPSVVGRILVDVASALDAAHRQKIVHRDVKPGNVLLEEETGRVLLTDFGIATPLATGDFSPSRLTTRDRVLGDARYRSPEQLTGEEVSELADIYGLGLLGFELLTGEGPYEAFTPTEWLAAHLHAAPRAASDLRPDVDPELEDLLLRCLSKVPEHRPGAADVVRQLASSEGVAPEPVPPPSPPSAAAGVADDGAGDVEEGEQSSAVTAVLGLLARTACGEVSGPDSPSPELRLNQGQGNDGGFVAFSGVRTHEGGTGRNVTFSGHGRVMPDGNVKGSVQFNNRSGGRAPVASRSWPGPRTIPNLRRSLAGKSDRRA